VRILILGAYGMVGHKLFLTLSKRFDLFATCRSFHKKWSHILPKERLFADVHADNFDSVIGAVQSVAPDVVINCIGIVKQLDAAKDPVVSININALFPHMLANLCGTSGAKLIHFSTDCVFSGRKGRYTEDDICDAEDLYGRTKYLGEVSGKGCLTIRSSVIGRELGTSTALLEWFLSQRGKKVKGFSKAIYTGFTTKAMADIVIKIIEKHSALSGVWQVASKPISKYELLCMINRRMGLNVDIEKDEQFVCDRSLDGSRFVEETGIATPIWEKMIDQLVDEEIFYSSKRSSYV